MLGRMLRTVLVALIVGGVLTTAAYAESYSPPEFGRCLKVATPKTGVFGNAVCTKKGGTKANEYEWFKGPGPKPNFTIKLKAKTILTITLKESLNTMTCTGLSGTGEYVADPQTRLIYHGVKLTGCSGEASSCTSAGQASGTIVTDDSFQVASGLANSQGSEPLLFGFALGYDEEGVWARFTCGGAPWRIIGGDPLGDVAMRVLKPNKMLLQEVGVWNQSEGNQIPQFVNGDFKQWHCDIHAGEPGAPDHPCGVGMSIVQKNEEKMELNSVY